MAAIAEWLLVIVWARVLAIAFLPWLPRFGAKEQLVQYSDALKVSVVVPAYNEAAQISATLAALAQLMPPAFEVIVVNDGSSDNTAHLAQIGLKEIQNGRLIGWRRNRGKVAALNAGVAEAKGDFILTVDADTRLEKRAIAAGLSRLFARDADAVAAQLSVDSPANLLQRFQDQEYLVSLNYERRAQERVGAVSVLPGAATVFRRRVLAGIPFSARTTTEDADITLAMCRRGDTIAMAAYFRAQTDAPSTWLALIRQRTRWSMGHIQCCAIHAPQLATPWRLKACVSVGNFLVATMTPVIAGFCMLALTLTGPSPALGLTVWLASAVSVAVVYAQRLFAIVFEGLDRPWNLLVVLLEPLVSSFVAALSFGCAIIGLFPAAVQAALLSGRR